MGRNKKTNTDEFKKECIEGLMEGKPASGVCAGNSTSPSTLFDWKRTFLDIGFCNKEN